MNDNVFETGLETVNVPLFRAVRTINGKPADENGNYELPLPDSQKQADWNQNDATAPDYIKNKPFYAAGDGRVVLVNEQANAEDIMDEGIGCASLKSVEALEVGKKYTVVMDDAYNCVCYSMKGDDRHYVCLGNAELCSYELPDAKMPDTVTDEPFGIVDNGDGDLLLYTRQIGKINIEISREESVVHLDEKYLPESVGSIVLRSSSPESTALFRITVDDFGELTVSPV